MRAKSNLSLRKRAIKLRNDKNKFLKELRRKNKAYDVSIDLLKNPISSIEDQFNLNISKNKDGFLQIELPERIDWTSSYAEICGVIRAIRRYGLREKKPIFLVFNKVKHVSPSALLMLAAEIHRCRKILGSKHIIGNYPLEKKVEIILEDFGFFKLLGIKNRNKSQRKNYPMEYIDFVSHIHEVKGTVRNFREALLGTAIEMSAPAKGRLYRALTEAMLNVRHHAYPPNSYRTNPERGRWWLSGHVNKKSGDLIIMFCDLGVGIPRTLPKIYNMERIRQALSILPGINPPDGDMIKAAMTLGRTRTEEENRGRGLNDLRSFINQAEAGQLEIYSKKGYYLYNFDGSEKVINREHNMGGTLIVWTVPLSTITNWAENEVVNHD